MQGFYASARHGEPAGLGMIGFRGVPDGVDPSNPNPGPPCDIDQLALHYDFVVVGAGAGGGVAAGVLAEGGARVLLLERPRPHQRRTTRRPLPGKRAGLDQVTASPGRAIPGHRATRRIRR